MCIFGFCDYHQHMRNENNELEVINGHIRERKKIEHQSHFYDAMCGWTRAVSTEDSLPGRDCLPGSQSTSHDIRHKGF